MCRVIEWAFVITIAVSSPEGMVRQAATMRGLDPDFCACVVRLESNFAPDALGDFDKNGEPLAEGLWQIHKPTWEFIQRKRGKPLTDLRLHPEEATAVALWAIEHGYAKWWSVAKLCGKGEP